MGTDPKAEKLFEKLANATFAQDEAEVRKLAAKVSPELRPFNFNGDSLLRVAIRRGVSRAVVEILVENGAKLAAKNGKGATPVDAALELDRVDLIEYFASKGAKVKFVPFEKRPQKDKDARLASILDSWYQDDCAPRMAAALAGGADPRNKVNGVSAMQRIAGHGDFPKLYEALLAAGGDPAERDKQGDTPAHLMARHGYAKSLALVLDAGVPLDLRDAKGNTLLHRAAGDGYNGSDKTVELLVERGADPLAKNTAGKTVLDVATREHKEMLAKKVSKPVSSETRALIEAVVANDAKKLAKLLASGAEPCEVDATSGKSWGSSSLSGVSALHVAFGRGIERSTVDMLLAHPKLDVNVKAVDGRTPLHIVMQFGQGDDQLADVRRLVELGADVNIASDRGETPIFEAASFYELARHLELVDVLLAAGASKETVDRFGETMLDKMFEQTQRFSEVNDKKGFVAMMSKLVGSGFATQYGDEIATWMKVKGSKYAPAPKGAAPPEPAKPVKPSKERVLFDKITGGTLHELVDQKTTLELGGKRHPVAMFDFFVFAAEQRDDKSDRLEQIAEYHVDETAIDKVSKRKWIPFGIVGMNGAVDNYREIGVDGTLYVDLEHAKGSDAPVVFATQSYMGLSPAKPLKVGKLTYKALLSTLKGVTRSARV